MENAPSTIYKFLMRQDGNGQYQTHARGEDETAAMADHFNDASVALSEAADQEDEEAREAHIQEACKHLEAGCRLHVAGKKKK
jgi:hypothetical protein